MGTVFLTLYNSFRKKKKIFFVFLTVIILLITWFASHITFEEDILKIIPSNERTQKYAELTTSSPFANRLIINISLSDSIKRTKPDLLTDFSNTLVDSLEKLFVPDLIARIDRGAKDTDIKALYDEVYRNLPLFLEAENYTRIDSLIHTDSIKNTINNHYKTLITPAGMGSRDFILKDPLGLGWMAMRKLEAFKFDDSYKLHEWQHFSSDLRHLLIFIEPALPHTETNRNSFLLEKLDDLNNSISEEFKQQVSFEYFGTMAVSVSNANQIRKDIYLTLTIAAVLLLVFMSLFFRKKFIFVAIFFPALLGGGTALAVLFMIKESISAVSLGIGAVILGITVDYALHYFTHLRNSGNIRSTLKDVATPVLMSSLTTAAAFLCLFIISSDAIKDLGLFASVSVIIAALSTLIIFPQFYREKPQKKQAERKTNNIVDRFASVPLHQKKILQIIVIVLTIVFYFFAREVQFEGDMNNMSYVSKELQTAEKNLDRISNYTLRSMFLISSAPELDKALEQLAKADNKINVLQNNGIISKSISVINLLPPKSVQNQKIQDWNDFWDSKDREAILDDINTAAVSNGFKDGSFRTFSNLLNSEFQPIQTADIPILFNTFLNPYIIEKEDKAIVTTMLRVASENKSKVYDEFNAFSDLLLFDRQFVTDTFIDVLRKDFDKLIWVSLLVVFLILVMAFGRIELGTITFLPMLMSWIWTLGIMSLLNIKFNIFNIVISTFIFGLGIDYSIFIMRGMMQDFKYGIQNLKSYKTSVLLSAITTIIGIGVLIIAKHPALQSIAISAIIGILSVVLISFTIEPLLFNWLVRNKGKARTAPVTFETFIFSIWTFIVFLAGSILLSISGIVLFTLLFFIPMEKRKYGNNDIKNMLFINSCNGRQN